MFQLISFLSLTIFSHIAIAVPLVDPTMPANYKIEDTTVINNIVDDSETSPVLILNTTLIDPYQQLAVINGKQLTVGEEVESAELVEIGHQYVKLRFQEDIITLELHNSFISKLRAK